uniref:Uncharacterized protein n=1 Tax=Bubo bubo TaxID=30461 RepID=A0A8C0ERV1_BUBBB
LSLLVNIVAFGNERDGFSEDSQQSSLIYTYLGRSALISQIDSSLSASHVGIPVFTEYQACVFGNVRLVVRDCPVWVRDWSHFSLTSHCPPPLQEGGIFSCAVE